MTFADILEHVGEFGPWQIQQLLLLWVPVLVCGAQLQILDIILTNPEELFCSIDDCQDYPKPFLDTADLEVARDHYQAIWPAAQKLSRGIKEDDSGIEMNIYKDYCSIFIPKVLENGTCFWNKTKKKDNSVYSCTNNGKIKYKTLEFMDSIIIEFDLGNITFFYYLYFLLLKTFLKKFVWTTTRVST